MYKKILLLLLILSMGTVFADEITNAANESAKNESQTNFKS